jgi:hypothetical protein
MNIKLQKIQFKGDPLDDLWKKKSFQALMTLKVREVFESNKEDLIDDFEQHPISQEIENPSKGNISGTLSSYFDYDGKKPDLFGFVGFYSGANPIADVANFLQKNINISGIRFIRKYGKRPPRINLTFKMPSIYDFSQIAKDHTDPIVTTNWVKAMETGLRGFQYYKVLDGKGRSKRAVQYENKLRNGKFKPKKYMSNLLKDFKRKTMLNPIL